MSSAEIFMRRTPRDPWELWAIRQGTRADIRDSAERLVVDMVIEEGLRAPAARIGHGQAITRRKVAHRIEEARA